MIRKRPIKKKRSTSNSLNSNGTKRIPRKPVPSLYDLHRGRNSKCTDEMIDEICMYLRNGLPAYSACVLVGITDQTYQNWCSKGKDYLENGTDGYERYGKFLERSQRAIEQYHYQKVKALNTKEYNTNWVREITVLERRYSKYWARPPANIHIDSGDSKYDPDESFM